MIQHIIFKSIIRQDLLGEMFVAAFLHKMMHLRNEQIQKIDKFNEFAKPKSPKTLTFQNAFTFLKGRHKILDGSESKIFPIGNQIQRKGRPDLLASVAKVSDRW